MENLNQAFTHINQAFSSTNHLFDRKIAANPDVPPTEVVHVPNLDDVQSFLLAPMEVDEPDQVPQSGINPHPELYQGPMNEELSRQINDAIANSWRVDLYKDPTPAAPEESGLSLGLTQEESTWLKMLMKGPVLRSRARAIDDAAYVNSLDVSSARLREYDRRLLELLTPKQFYQEVDAFFGSESSTNVQDAEVEVQARDDADEICLVDTNRSLPQTKIQMIAVDYNDPTAQFGFDPVKHLAGNAGDEEDEMNSKGIFELGQYSGVEDDDCRSWHDVQNQSNPAEAVTPQAPHNQLDMDDEESEYEPPDCFDSPSPSYQDYRLGPFVIDNSGTFPYTAPEAEMSAHQTDHSEFWHEGFGPAMLSHQNSDQPMNLVSTEGNIFPNKCVSADLQLEAELNASTNEHSTESPGPFTRLLKSTDDDDTPLTDEIHCPELRMRELALGERMHTSTNIQEPPTSHRIRTPSPLKSTQRLTPTIPLPSTTPLPKLLPRTRPPPPTQTITIHTQNLPYTSIRSPRTPTKPRPFAPKEKSVKAIFASPKLRSGPPSPVKPDTPTKTVPSAKRTCADPAQHRATSFDFDDGDTVHVALPVSGQGLGVGLGLGLGLAQMQPDSAVDVSFPAVEKEEASRTSKSVSVSVSKVTMKTPAKAKAKATTKRKVGRPRKVRNVLVDDGAGAGRGVGVGVGLGGGEKVTGVARSPLRKKARKGARGAVGGGGA